MAAGTISTSIVGPFNLSNNYNPLSITATGTVTATASSYGLFGGAGTTWTIINDGAVTADSYGVKLNGPATISSTGTIAGDDGIYLGQGGSVSITGGMVSGSGTILGSGFHGTGIFVSSTATGIITNSATVTGANYGVALSGGGEVTNSGSIFGGGHDAIKFDNQPGTVVNSGRVVGAADDGIGLIAGGAVSNQAGGFISGPNGGVYIKPADATVTNAGTITTTGTNGVAVFFANGGTVTNSAGGTLISNTAVIIKTGAGFIDNSGGITGTTSYGVQLGAGGQITNTGSIAGFFRAVQLSTGGGTVTNNGLIAGSGSSSAGVGNKTGGLPAVVANTGTISGAGYGIALDGGGTVTNTSGIITGGEDGIRIAIKGATAASGSIINSASIIATVDDGIGLFDGGSVINNATGVIAGATAKGAGIYITGAIGTVTNAGTITGSSYGLDLLAGGTVTNSGTISGTGTTAHAVTFGGAGANRLVLEPTGVFVGDAVGSATAGSTNTLELAAGTTGTISGASGTAGMVTANGHAWSFSNFSNIALDSGAVWALSGSSTVAGSLSVASGATLTGGTLTVAGTITNNGTIFSDRLVLDPTGVVVGNVLGSAAVGSTNTLELAGGTTGTISGASGTAGTVTANGHSWSFSNFSNIALDTGAVWALSGSSTVTGSLSVASGATLTSGTLTLAGTITNSGTISSNRLVLDPTGAVVGGVTGGATAGSGNALELAGGTGTISGASGTAGTVTANGHTWSFSNFSNIALNTGAVWSLSGDSTVAGSLSVASGATLTSGSLRVAGTGILTDAGALNVTGALTLSGASSLVDINAGAVTNVAGAVAVGSGDTVSLAGGTLAASAGIADNGIIIGTGKITGVLSGSGAIKANNGTLDLASDIAAAAGPTFSIGTGAGTALQLDGAVGAGHTFAFAGASGALRYTHSGGMAATISGLNVGTSNTQPTNLLDYTGHTVTIVGSNAHSGTAGTVRLSDGSTLALTGITGVTGNWYVDTRSDGGSGTGIFLSTAPVGSAPTVTSVQSSPAGGVLGIGAEITLTLAMSAPVTLDTTQGSPTLTLNNGGTATYDALRSNSGMLAFDYFVGSGQDTQALEVSRANLNGAVLTDQNGNDANLSGAAARLPGALDIESIAAFDVTSNQPIAVVAQSYTGPVAGLQHEYINITSDNLNVSAATPNWFIHSGSGEDALSVTSGNNVLDGGTGSNFLTGGSGTDTFFVDDRGASADTWSTIVNFHAGDAVTIWGVTPGDFQFSYQDNQGAGGFTGLTVHATAPGLPTASVTFAGFTSADLGSGRISESFGIDLASGSTYTYFRANS